MIVFFSGQTSVAAVDGYFGNFIGQPGSPIIMFLLFLGVTTIVVLAGVEKGVERVSKFMMPILLLISIAICIYVTTIPNSLDGIKYYMLPDFSKFSFKTVCAAMGQMFYAMTLPKVFDIMPMGTIIGAAFFVLVLLAALTSSISIMEAIASNIMDRFKMSRTKAVVLIVLISLLLGIASSMGNGAWSHITILGMDFLTLFDYLSNSVLMPVVALGTCILIGWRVGTKVIEDEVAKTGEKMSRVWCDYSLVKGCRSRLDK